MYGVEGNSTYLECVPRSPQAEARWTVQRSESRQQTRAQTHERRETVRRRRGFNSSRSRVLSLVCRLPSNHSLGHSFLLCD